MERAPAHLPCDFPFDFAALRSGRTELPPDSSLPIRAERRPQGGVEV